MKEFVLQLKDGQFSYLLLRLLAVLIGAIIGANLLSTVWEKYYTVLHTVLEIICITIAASSFLAIWYTSKVQKINLILGLAFLAVAVFDIFHTYFWQGLGLYPAGDYDLSARYWLAGRFIEALFLVLSTTAVGKLTISRWLGLSTTLVFSLTVSLIFLLKPQLFPILLTPDGVTPIKIAIEYIIIFMFLIFLIRVFQGFLQEDVVAKDYLILAGFTAISAELCFTVFTTVTSFYNLLGHVFKISYYYFFLKAVFSAFVVFPYTKMQQATKIHCELLDNLLDGIGIYSAVRDTNGKIVDFIISYVNKSYCKLNRLPKQDLIGKRLLELYPDLNPELFDSYLHVAETGESLFIESYCEPSKKQSRKNCAFDLQIFKYEDGFALNWRDVTQRKQKEDMLRLSEERFLKAFKYDPLLKSIRSLQDGRYVDVNEKWLQTMGYNKNEVIGKTVHELKLPCDEVDEQQQIDIIANRRTFSNEKLTFRTKDGVIRSGLFSTQEIDLQGEPCVLITTIDVTDQLHYEKEIARLERLNLIGQMSAGIGHEIRNPMTTVRGFLQHLGTKNDLQGYSNYFELMISELDRANSIITEFLSLSKKKVDEAEYINLDKLISIISPMMQAHSFKVGKEIILDLNCQANFIANSKELCQIVLNLLNNALEASPLGGTVIIKTECKNNCVTLSVSDNGPGIPNDILGKMGTPFFTTKDTGTGLGLAVCYSIAERHNATIDVETGPWGTTFFVHFPLEISKNCISA